MLVPVIFTVLWKVVAAEAALYGTVLAEGQIRLLVRAGRQGRRGPVGEGSQFTHHLVPTSAAGRSEVRAMESPFSVVSVSFPVGDLRLELAGEGGPAARLSKPWMSLSQAISVISAGLTVTVSPSTLTSAPKWLQPSCPGPGPCP